MKIDVRTVSGNIVDVLNSETYPGTLKIFNGKIVEITRDTRRYGTYIVPGLVDAHVHIESSMLTPSEFARVAATHGTVATVSDPHEVANVLGIDGVRYMIDDARRAPVKFCFGAPSCVPATSFETAGACLGPEQVEELLRLDEVKYLAEVMNVPGVLNDDPTLARKIDLARKYAKPIDGHAPGLRGKDLRKYVSAGISTDHECLTEDEALEKIKLGMNIQIREGSAAKNFEELIPIAEQHYGNCMFCSDDKHPDDLLRGHMNELVKRALNHGIDVMKVLRIACVNPVLHYKLDVGLLRVNDPADFLVVDDLKDFNILRTYINGDIIAEEGESRLQRRKPKIVNNFRARRRSVRGLALPYRGGNINVIKVVEGQLITHRLVKTPKTREGYVVSDADRDTLKTVVVNRYEAAKPAIGFSKGFGLMKGAIASSVAHDSHNVVTVGVDDQGVCEAINLVVQRKGGVSVVSQHAREILPMPIGGIMSDQEYSAVADENSQLDRMAKSLGSKLNAPFMTLSFVALLVIPQIKLSDRGLFDSERFTFIDLFESSETLPASHSVHRIVRGPSRRPFSFSNGQPLTNLLQCGLW